MTLPLVIVPVFNAFELLGPCLDAIGRNVPANARVLLIDDASTDHRVQPLLKSWVNSTDRNMVSVIHSTRTGRLSTLQNQEHLLDGV